MKHFESRYNDDCLNGHSRVYNYLREREWRKHVTSTLIALAALIVASAALEVWAK